MNAVAAVFGAAPQDAARRAVDLMLARMPARAAGRRVDVSGPLSVMGASGRDPACGDRPGFAALTGDVRLADGRALRRDLGLAAETPDAETLLEAFARRGDGFARDLTGEFAFTILDRRASRLIAVRDQLGVRPLFYRHGPSDVRIASELAALVEPGDRPDEGFLAEFLAGQLVDAGATPYAAVRRVPPAHVLLVDAGGVRLVRYWDPPVEPLRGPRAAHAERLRAALDEAVRSCCAGQTRVGVHLSGGLDSSSVLAAVIATGAAEPVAASLVFPWPEADERPWIAEVASHCDVRPLLVDAPRPSPHGLADIRTHRDLPDLPHGFPMFAAMTGALRAEPVDVVLTGLGGDQWWTGDAGHAADLVRRLDFGALRTWASAGPSMGELEWIRGDLWRHGLRPLVPAPLRRFVSDMLHAHVPAWIDASFAARVGLHDRLRRRPDTRDAPSEAWRRMRWRLDCADEAAGHERMDRLGVTFGMEMRHPMYDRRLVELAFSIPDSSRIAGGRGRVVLREAMAPRLPRAVVDRTSKGDVSQVWIDAARSPDLAPYLGVPMLTGLGWIRPPIVADIVERTRERGDTTAAHAFWLIVSVEAWFHEVFGGR